MTPYAILGLDEDESDERTIKRAYAKLLKRHRPDQDPEGFKRIHDAYQWITEREAGPLPVVNRTNAPSDAATMPLPEPMAQAEDVAWSPAIENLNVAADLPPGIAREESITRALTSLMLLIGCGVGDLAQARLLIVPLVLENPRRCEGSPEAALVRLLESEPACLESRVLELMKQGDHQRTRSLLGVWLLALEEPGRDLYEEMPVLERIIIWCVFLDYVLSQRIVACMVRKIPADRLTGIDLALASGHEAQRFPPIITLRLAGLLSGSDFFDTAAMKEAGSFIMGLDQVSPTRRLMQNHAMDFPVEVLRIMDSPPAKHTSFHGLPIGVGLFVFIMIVRRCLGAGGQAPFAIAVVIFIVLLGGVLFFILSTRK